MDEKDWLIITTVYEEKNITKAANKLFTSQPAITYRLNQLEEEVGVRLIWRDKKGIKFTPQGEYIVKYAKEMLVKLQQTKDHLLNTTEESAGMIRLGVSSNYARFILPDVLKEFSEKYSNIQFKVFTGWSYEVLKEIEQDNIALGIVRGDIYWQNNKVLLNRESLCIISKDPIDLTGLPQEPRIVFKTDPKLQQIMDSWWYSNYSQPPAINMEIDNIETCTKLVSRGLGYAIVPELAVTDMTDLHKVVLKDGNEQPLNRPTWLIYKETEVLYPAVQNFIDFLTRTYTPAEAESADRSVE
ncbi:LysR family transcriptional regulator [Microbacterium sp. APC 3898]|uniref:LysR family transcriptional regulator n=2 Tax=Planococcus TaxID=1372 RepID=A0ABT7ZJ19_9BACL|nr:MULTISPECIES: LysR family transcriptional regulator [Terrabacteria group]MBD8015569.1 LysR family transcriptional regulator [Planococcus wigleyi]MDN3426687.1 LysR family transcriptional regulator [Planococcus sp. APC 4016]MDN3437949.1 LysR family transcriptional regulator [Planococcus sp. APC 3900]MDN3500349.1 LysR family transcriptional regulator [Microbacterium sp. APC 3898]